MYIGDKGERRAFDRIELIVTVVRLHGLLLDCGELVIFVSVIRRMIRLCEVKWVVELWIIFLSYP